MDFGTGLFCGLLLALIFFGIAVFGMLLGLELAVDGTQKGGYFKAYGKKWKAIAAECV